MRNRKMISSIMVVAALVFVSGCATKIKEQTIKQKTAIALGLESTEDLKITDRVNNKIDGTIKYVAHTVDGKRYNCAFVVGSSAFYTLRMSDAQCIEIVKRSKKGAKQDASDSDPACNALLKSAGRCK